MPNFDETSPGAMESFGIPVLGAVEESDGTSRAARFRCSSFAAAASCLARSSAARFRATSSAAASAETGGFGDIPLADVMVERLGAFEQGSK